MRMPPAKRFALIVLVLLGVFAVHCLPHAAARGAAPRFDVQDCTSELVDDTLPDDQRQAQTAQLTPLCQAVAASLPASLPDGYKPLYVAACVRNGGGDRVLSPGPALTAAVRQCVATVSPEAVAACVANVARFVDASKLSPAFVCELLYQNQPLGMSIPDLITCVQAALAVGIAVENALPACQQQAESDGKPAAAIAAVLVPPEIALAGCDPQSGMAPLAVSCSASVNGVTADSTLTWSAPGGSVASSGTESLATTFSASGTYTISFTACTFTACTVAVTFSITVLAPAAAPTITSLGCAPGTVNTGDPVTCAPTFGGTEQPTSLTWTSGGSPGSGSDPSFTTRFNTPGSQSITLSACNGTACASQSQAITVNDAPTPPTIDALGCGPATVNTGDTVSCAPTIKGTVTGVTWTAPNGAPGSGSGITFATKYTTTGAQAITLQACNGTLCVSKDQIINVLRKDPTPAPTPVQQRPPITLHGSITVTEGDVGCGFSAMPSSSGTLTITLTFGANPGDPIVATGNLSGGTAGSRTVGCGGGSASEAYNASYSANFSGVVDPRAGAITLNGTMRVTQSSSFSNCKDGAGGSVSCPGGATPASYPLTVSGTINIPPNAQSASGSGSLTMQSGCSTAGSWRST